ncbi:MAG: transposase, partial [Acidimicrobiales bacterium]
MTLGLAPRQADLLRTTAGYCEGRVAPESIYGVLHRECHNLFPDEVFADLFTDTGRRSVPPMIVAVVMVLQRIEGLSDREAVDRFAFDARWKYAAGGLDFDYPGFVHTVLVDMRARLARSDRPERIFQATLEAAKTAGLVGRRRVLDSTPLYDAVATMDTVTLIRSAIRGLLKVADTDLETELRARLCRDDDYTAAGKPACDYDDPDARAGLVDALGRDAMALLGVLDDRELEDGVSQAGQLLATVVGQDLDTDDEGVFRIARKVARDRVISTVDPEARHGHKTSARGFDGYKGHIGIDPDSEIVTATTVTPGNSGDVEAAEDLLADVLPPAQPETEGGPEPEGNGGPAGADVNDEHDEDDEHDGDHEHNGDEGEAAPAVYGDAAYGAGKLLARLENAGADIKTKVQPPVAPGGRFT